MDNFRKKSRVYKPAPWRYRIPAPTNEQPGDVVLKEIRRNKHGLEIFDDLFDDDDNKNSETEDDSIPMRSAAGDQKNVRRVKRMSAFSPVRSSSEDESESKTPADNQPRIMVMDTTGRLIARDEVPHLAAELKRRRFEGPIRSDTSRERESGLEGGKQLDVSRPRPVNKQLRKRLSSTPNNESRNDAIVSPNLTEIGMDDAIPAEWNRFSFNDAIPVERKRFSFSDARKSGGLGKPDVSAGPNPWQKLVDQNSLKISHVSVNSKQLDAGNAETAQARSPRRTNSHKRPNVEENCSEFLKMGLDEWHDGDFELPPEQRSYVLKNFYESMKQAKKRKGTLGTLDEIVDDGAIDEDIEDESLDGDYKGGNEIELPKKKMNITAEFSSFHEGQGDSDAPSGYLDDETSAEVLTAKIRTGRDLKSTNTNDRMKSAKTSRKNAADPKSLRRSLQITPKRTGGENMFKRSARSSPNKKTEEQIVEKSHETMTKKAVVALNTKTNPEELPSRRNLRRKNEVTEEQASKGGVRSKKTSPYEAVKKRVSLIRLKTITDVINKETSLSNGTDERENRGSKPTSPEKVTEERVLRRGPLSRKLSLNKSNVDDIGMNNKTSPLKGTEERVTRPSKQISPEKVTEERVLRRGPLSRKLSQNKSIVEDIGMNNKTSSPNGTEEWVNRPSKQISPEKVPRRGPLSKKLSLNKSRAKVTLRISPELSVNDVNDVHALRRSFRLKEISPNVDEEERLSPNVDEEERLSPNVDEEERLSPNVDEEERLSPNVNEEEKLSSNESNNNNNKVDARPSVENRSSNEARCGLMKLRDKVRKMTEDKSERVQSATNRDERTPGSSSSPDSLVLKNVRTKPSSRHRSRRKKPGKHDSRKVETKSSSRSKSQRRNRVEDPPLKKQIIIPEENKDENLRRSIRTRLPRLATWDWELPRYKLDSEGFRVIDSISTPIPDPHSKGYRGKRAVKKTKQDIDQREDNLLVDKSVVSVPMEALPVIEPSTNDIVYKDLISKFPLVEFCGPDGAPATTSDPYVMSINLNHKKLSFGFLLIRPKCEKESERLSEHSLVFNVIVGKVLATVHCTSFVAKDGDYFIVPMGNQYRIENPTLSEAKLTFTKTED